MAVFVIVILIYNDLIDSFSYIFLARSLLFLIYALIDIFLYFKVKIYDIVTQKGFFILTILDLVDFFSYFIIFSYLKFGKFRVGTMVLIFVHLIANIVGYCITESHFLEINRNPITSFFESVILIMFVFKICIDRDRYSWNGALSVYAATAYILIVIVGFSTFFYSVAFLCLVCF